MAWTKLCKEEMDLVFGKRRRTTKTQQDVQNTNQTKTVDDMDYESLKEISEDVTSEVKLAQKDASRLDYMTAAELSVFQGVQIRLDSSDKDFISRTVDWIRRHKSLEHFEPIVFAYVSDEVYRKIIINPKKALKEKHTIRIDGKHSNTIAVECVEAGILPKDTKFPVVFIDQEMLPEDIDDCVQVLRWVAAALNRVPKQKRSNSTEDLKRELQLDINLKKNVDSKEYQSGIACVYDVDVRKVRKLIAQNREFTQNTDLNERFNFRTYHRKEMDIIKEIKQAELGDDVEVTWAVVTADKIYETLGKAVGSTLENWKCSAHIVFHFGNYADVSRLQNKTIKRVNAFRQKLQGLDLTYEFLPWKEESE